MRAILWTAYGPPEVLQLQEIEKPLPKDNEVLIRIYATTVSTGDCEFRSLKLPLYFSLPLRIFVGFTKPKRIPILGQELSGEIEATGKAVTRFKAGDQVFASTGFALGAYAEYTCLPAGGLLAIKPANLTYEEAAAIPLGGLEAADFLRRANIRSGQKVLIIGAGGSIGTLGVQLAKYFGAEVTAVDSTGKLDMLRQIGADHVIDYTRQDFTKIGESYDLIFDVIGKSSYSGSLRLLKKNGYYLLGNPSLTNRVRGRWTSLVSSKKILFATTNRKADDLIYLKELIEAEHLRPVIDRRYPLEQIIEAHRYVETGVKKGCVVITM